MNSLIRDLISAINNSNFEECIRICDMLITKDPSNNVIYEARGICYQRLMKTDEAGRDLLRATELNPASLYEIKEKLEKLISIEEDLKFGGETEPEDVKEFVTPEMKSLHDEIEEKTETPYQETRSFEPKPEVKYEPIFPEEEETGFFRTPLFFVLSTLLFLALFVFSVYWFILRQPEMETAVKTAADDTALVTRQDSAVNEATDKQESQPPAQETVKKEETEKTETSVEPPKQTESASKEGDIKLPHTVGFFGTKKQFMLVEEKNGFFVQVGSFKDKEKADKKLKFLESKGIKAEIYSVELEGRGTFYRVRAGSFDNPDNAKAIAGKLQ